MAKKVEIELNSAGIAELMKSDGVKTHIRSIAEEIRERCGDGYETEDKMGRDRSTTYVRTATPHAYYSNRKHNTILKAIGK